MHTEIERKFLVTDDTWRNDHTVVHCIQGYLQRDPLVIRVRIEGTVSFLTLKTPPRGITRDEFQYEIPQDDAQFLLDTFCQGCIVSKQRYSVYYNDVLWVVDEFLDRNKGLILAEVELEVEEQELVLPPWVGEEVSYDSRYFNSQLAQHPYTQW